LTVLHTRRRLLLLAATMLISGAGLANGYGLTETRLVLRQLPQGLRVVLVTDMHVHRVAPAWLVRRVRSLRPHVLLIGGDTWDELSPWPPRAALETVEALAEAAAEAYAVLGNHEHWAARRRGRDALRDAERLYAGVGVRLLADEAVDAAGGAIRLCGLDWRDDPSSYRGALHRLLNEGCNLILSHSPDVFEHASPSTGAVFLAGHTHGGQVCLPGARSIYTNSLYGYRWGLYRRGSAVLYVSRGLGEMIPPRLYCGRELVMLEGGELRPKEGAGATSGGGAVLPEETSAWP